MFSNQVLADLFTLVTNSHNICGVTKVITIDGPAGSGKTTLANELSNKLGECPIVHMDDLYGGWNQDLISELPNRIIKTILWPLQNKTAPSYFRFDWHENRFTENIALPVSEFLILEGVGSGHPQLHEFAALTIWIEADPKLLLDRLVARDGEALRAELVKWQTHEAAYFAQLQVKQLADVRISGD